MQVDITYDGFQNGLPAVYDYTFLLGSDPLQVNQQGASLLFVTHDVSNFVLSYNGSILESDASIAGTFDLQLPAAGTTWIEGAPATDGPVATDPPPASVPEPSIIGLMVLAALMVAGRRLARRTSWV